MPRGLHNWNYKQVKNILMENNFVLINTRGSHHYFSGNVGGIPRTVTVPFHGNSSIKTGTVKSIIIQSGLEKEIFLR